MFSINVLVVEESVHVAFDETNSIISNHLDDDLSANNLEKHSIYEESEKEKEVPNDEQENKEVHEMEQQQYLPKE